MKKNQAIRLALSVAGACAIVAGASAAAPDSKRMIVAFKPGAAAHAKAAVLAAKGAIEHEIFSMNAMSVTLPAGALKSLQNNPSVEYVEPDVIRTPFALATPSTGTPYATGQLVPYGIPMVLAGLLPEGDSHTGNRTVCIIDSGVDALHEDLNGNQFKGIHDNGTGDWFTDELHHGTHVAGTIAAINNADKGVVGVNPGMLLNIRIVKVFGADGWAYSSTLASAANQCGDNGANVISMSLGGAFSSKTEQKAFDALAAKGVLSVAAAGNDGNSRISYPAGYDSVMMVAALDENKTWAPFSQYNRKVEIAAPGVAVLSSVPTDTGSASSLKVGATVYAPGGMDGSPRATVSAQWADFGLGGSVVANSMRGKVCLIARGTYEFGVKVKNCQLSGGVGAVVYNNVAGSFGGTLGTTTGIVIPAVTASNTEGAAIKGQPGAIAALAVTKASYAYFDGTSMATPHVAAVAALVWSYFPTCTAAQIRASLGKSAEDLGALGRDNKYGYGLVRAKAAYDHINTLGCGN
ncbi:MAG: S8 family serine peptidase [Pseudomonadota bacterium]